MFLYENEGSISENERYVVGSIISGPFSKLMVLLAQGYITILSQLREAPTVQI